MTDIREKLAQIIEEVFIDAMDEPISGSELVDAQAQAIFDALPSLVKPLEWKHVDYGRLMGWRAKTEFGIYSVQSDHVYFEGCAIDHSGGTDKLKSAAQADYTRRILAALGVEQ